LEHGRYALCDVCVFLPWRNSKEKKLIYLFVCLFDRLAGHPPFQEESRDALFAKIVTGSFEFKPAEWKKVSVQGISIKNETMLNACIEKRST